ncbi:MAG: chromosome segregation protein SMC [Phycisphaerae bacterium]
MKLLSLELSGFKSFADTTLLKFDDGITCIVGPNGCGKSNVMDAVKWVLGEMSAKSLRGDAMLDVIFNGSSTRKPMGMAEVSLLFSNSDRRLPVEDAEVKITRRLYRDATSEYLVNNRTVRLKDIREMFLDTGIGVDAYSLIEQGKISILLESNNIDRREIFEEAAGISRFKARKKETLRRLEKTDQNLAQTQLVLQEVERQLRSIKVQAGRARSYQEYSSRVDALRQMHSLHEYDQLQRRLSEVSSQRSDVIDALAAKKRELDEFRQRQQDLQMEVEALQDAVREAERELSALESRRQTAAQQSQFAQQQARQLSEQRESMRQRYDEVQQRGQQLLELITQRQTEVTGIEQLLETRQRELAQAQSHQQTAARETAELNYKLEAEKSAAVELLRAAARVQSQVSTLQVRMENLNRQAERLTGQKTQLSARLAELRQQAAELQQQKEELTGQIQALRSRIDEVHGRQQANNQRLSDLLNQLGKKREARSGLQSRQAVLEDLQRRREGISDAVREVLKTRDMGKGFAYVKEMVGELFEADLEIAPVVEAALGDLQNALLIDHGGDLLADCEAWSKQAGRMTAICLDSLPGYREAGGWRIPENSSARWIIDMVRYPAEHTPLALHLLGRTILVDTLVEAQALRVAGGRDYRFVTRRGEVVQSDGVIQLGDLSRKVGSITRRGELNRLTEDIKQLDGEITVLAQQSGQCDQNGKALAADQQALREQLLVLETRHAQANAAWQQNQQLADRTKGEIPIVEAEAAGIAKQSAECFQQQMQFSAEATELEAKSHAAEQLVKELDQQVQQNRQELSRVAEQATALRVTVGQTQEQRAARMRELLAAKQNHQEALRQVQRMDEDLAALEVRMKELEQAGAQAAQVASELEQSCGTARTHVTENTERLSKLRQSTLAANNTIGELTRHADELGRQEHELSLTENEVSVRLETLVERAGEELRVNLVAAHAGYQAPADTDWDAVTAEITDLKGRMARLGNVNLDAVDELTELEKRQEFLSTQIADIVDAKKQLEELIAKINEDSRQRFIDTFEAVRKEFHEIFRKLFGGGKADIILETPEDVLESGIDILARPPGKELQSISLLSGGEKAMTAIALVLAVFKSKPSPFCVLDEVDAPLDEANTGRFASIIQEFLAHSQFIVITHNKRMMAIANILYGITMQEQGVSKRVAVRFDGKSQLDPAVKADAVATGASEAA